MAVILNCRFLTQEVTGLQRFAGEITSWLPALVPDLPLLEAGKASVPLSFVDKPSDELLFPLYQECLAFVFPAIEDFGITPVEAMTAGAPVIVSKDGGARESVEVIGGGTTFGDTYPAEWRPALSIVQRLDPVGFAPRALRFCATMFRSQVTRFISQPNWNTTLGGHHA